MKLIDNILELLSDGEWHHVKELLSATHAKPIRLLTCINFLIHHDFIQINRKEGKIKLLPQIKDFLDEFKEAE